MDIILKIQDAASGYIGCVFLAMFISMMIVGPWRLGKQLEKHAGVQYSINKRLFVSFFSGVMSILLFYLFFLKFVVNGAETRIPILLLFLVYLPMLHICVLYLIKFKGPKHLPMWAGWHLTVMAGVFTFLFSFLVSNFICNTVMLVESDYYFGQISTGIEKYRRQKGTYPPDMKALFDADFPPVCFVQSNSILWQYRPGKYENEKPRDYYHFLPLPENAPENLVWIWISPDLIESSKMPVMFFNSTTRIIQKTEFESSIERSRKWLTDHPPATNDN